MAKKPWLFAMPGVDVEVVPGISSAIAGPAAAGIPVTHRRVSSAFTVVTAHETPGKPDGLNWGALAQLGTTLVVLMGARQAPTVRDRLLAGGMSPTTPVAIVGSATRTDQTTTRLSLHQLGVEPVKNPSVIVIGKVAGDPVIGDYPAIESAVAELDQNQLLNPSITQPSPQTSPQSQNSTELSSWP